MEAIELERKPVGVELDRSDAELDWQYQFHERAELAILKDAMLAKARHPKQAYYQAQERSRAG